MKATVGVVGLVVGVVSGAAVILGLLFGASLTKLAILTAVATAGFVIDEVVK